VRTTKRRLTGALARAPALHRWTERFQAPGVLSRRHADQHLFDDATIERIGRRHRLKRGQGDLAGGRPDTRALDRDLPTTEDHFAARGPGPARRPIRLVGISRPADRRPILLEHRGEHLQPRAQRQFQQLGLRVDQQIDKRQMALRGFDLGNR